MSNVPNPGFRNQPHLRTAFRIAGFVILGIGVWLAATALREFFTLQDFEEPHKFWMLFVALPLLAVGGWCLQAGFMGVAARYVAGEGAPVVKDSVAYLTDGEGLLGVGRTVDDAGRDEPTKFCSSCGKPADVAARFCESCGHAFA